MPQILGMCYPQSPDRERNRSLSRSSASPSSILYRHTHTYTYVQVNTHPEAYIHTDLGSSAKFPPLSFYLSAKTCRDPEKLKERIQWLRTHICQQASAKPKTQTPRTIDLSPTLQSRHRIKSATTSPVDIDQIEERELASL